MKSQRQPLPFAEPPTLLAARQRSASSYGRRVVLAVIVGLGSAATFLWTLSLGRETTPALPHAAEASAAKTRVPLTSAPTAGKASMLLAKPADVANQPNSVAREDLPTLPRRAADLLFAGRHQEALGVYRVLARELPQQSAYATAAAILSRRHD